MNEVERNRELFGPECFATSSSKTFLEFVWEATQDRVLILLSGSGISLAVHFRNGGWIEGAAILLAVVIVVNVNAVNDWKKDLLFRSLNQKSKGNEAKVKDPVYPIWFPYKTLVLFDIIQLEPGVKNEDVLINYLTF